MKHILLLSVTFICINLGLSQDGKILSKELVDFTKTPVWDKSSPEGKFKKRFEYLDNLTFHFITYESDKLTVKGFLIEPKKEGKYPVIIYNRGGNRDYGQPDQKLMVTYLSKLAESGYIIIGSFYRTKDEFGGAEINDVLNLIETAKEIKNADTNRIGMYGRSRGGMMTYLALQKSDKIKTAIVGNGVTDYKSHIEERPIMETKVLAECVPNYWENKEVELKNRSVIEWADELNKNSSLLILSGTKDKLVHTSHADKIATILTEINYNFILKKYDTGHGFSGREKDLNTEVINWFNNNL